MFNYVFCLVKSVIWIYQFDFIHVTEYVKTETADAGIYNSQTTDSKEYHFIDFTISIMQILFNMHRECKSGI